MEDNTDPTKPTLPSNEGKDVGSGETAQNTTDTTPVSKDVTSEKSGKSTGKTTADDFLNMLIRFAVLSIGALVIIAKHKKSKD